MKKILNFGSLNLDYVYSVAHFVNAGETISSEDMITNCGGKGLNQSVAAAKAGANVFHAGNIGENGDMLKDMLNDSGVNTDYLLKTDGPNGHAIIQVNESGENCIILFSGSNSKITTEQVDNCLANFCEGDYIILQNEINNIPYIMKKCKEKGIKIVFNPSPITDSLFDYPIEDVSLLILNEIEGEALSGTDDTDKMPDELKKRYPDTNILLTLGADGAVYFDGNKKIRHGVYRTKVVDTTAAGDTILGYFTEGIASGLDEAAALERASKASAITISRHGAGQSIPTSDEVAKCDFEYLG